MTKSIAIAVAVIFGLAAIWLYVAESTGPRSDLRKCDESIKSLLKAPSTYRRIEGDRSTSYGILIYDITYEAQNDFGVPLRSTGECWVEGDRATWTESGMRENLS